MRTQVAIVGAGPAGLLLGALLHRAGIDTVVLEQRSAAHVLSRVRAGVLEPGTVALLARAGVDARLRAQGLSDDGFVLAWDGAAHRVDLRRHTGHAVTVYGQTEVTRDLMDARAAAGATTHYAVEGVALHGGLDDTPPRLTWHGADGREQVLHADFVAGCDGFHGVCRASVPAAALRTFEKVWPFAWLGVLADVPPLSQEIVYAAHPRGFALASLRSPTRSRCYVQCPATDRVADWSDERFWAEFALRLPPELAGRLVTGASFEKSLAPLRSFVTEPMRFGRLFLAGDAAHIVPPTGAKGLNLAASDVALLSQALVEHYRAGSDEGLARYSERALARVWRAERFSWWFTALMHDLPGASDFDRRLQHAELRALCESDAAQAALAECYVGWPGRG